jgi:hypothetical protein
MNTGLGLKNCFNIVEKQKKKLKEILIGIIEQKLNNEIFASFVNL